jgi:hypothetical protein
MVPKLAQHSYPINVFPGTPSRMGFNPFIERLNHLGSTHLPINWFLVVG